jgi:hypothetical protein
MASLPFYSTIFYLNYIRNGIFKCVMCVLYNFVFCCSFAEELTLRHHWNGSGRVALLLSVFCSIRAAEFI